MEVARVDDESARVVVETTGAIYVLDRTDPARVSVTQKINGPRELCQMEFDASFADLAIDYHAPDQCVLYVPVDGMGFNITIHGDSLFALRAPQDVRCRVRGAWTPEYSYAEAGNLLFLDATGGFGQYALPAAHPWGGPHVEPKIGVSFSRGGWETFLSVPTGRTLLTCVAPPRPYDHVSSVEDRIVHHWVAERDAEGRWLYIPDDATIEDYARHGNILVLHAGWQRCAGPVRDSRIGGSTSEYTKTAPWASRHPVPHDDAAFRRAVETAQRLGMRVLPYLSPYFHPGTRLEFLEALTRLLGDYGLDGFYFDGVSSDVAEAHEIMKGTRRIIGEERLLYVHIPSPILGSSYADGRYVYSPFTDAYANYILRAECIDTFDDATLKYTISGRNFSNAIGFVCNYNYGLDFNRTLIRKALEVDVRVPWWGLGWDLYNAMWSRDVQKAVPRMSEIHEIMESDYFPALDRLRC